MTLRGQRILITRASDQAAALAARFRARGADVLEAAAIAVRPVESPELDEALRGLAAYDWLVLTSPNGVKFLFERLTGPLPEGLHVAAVGPSTARALESRGVRVDLVPERHDGEGLASALAGRVAGKRVLLARGNLAGADLPQGLRAAGAAVDAVVVYETASAELDASGIEQRLAEGTLDWAVFASGSAFRALVQALAQPERLAGVSLASIGPKTSAVMRELGFAPAAEARSRSLDGLVAAVEEATSTDDVPQDTVLKVKGIVATHEVEDRDV